MRARRSVSGIVLASSLAACSSTAPVDTRPYDRHVVADVALDVPDGWEEIEGPSEGFGAALWISEPVLSGTSLAVSIDVACTGRGGGDAEEALTRYLDAPQWQGHETMERGTTDVDGAGSAASFTATYVLPLAATGRDGEITRRGVMAASDGVAALVLVEGLSEAYDHRMADRVLSSLRFDAATEDRVAECAAD